MQMYFVFMGAGILLGATVLLLDWLGRRQDRRRSGLR
jgi:hypothetical protein